MPGIDLLTKWKSVMLSVLTVIALGMVVVSMADLAGSGGGAPKKKAPPPQPRPSRSDHVQEILKHRQEVVQHQGTTGRGSTSPPLGDRQASLPPDPVGASAKPLIKQAALHASVSNDATDSAQANARTFEKSLADQHAAAQELINRANPDYNAEAAAQFDQAHGGSNAIYQKDPTTLLLNSVGYTGNGIQDFNAQVARVQKVFNDVYGHDPTPGFILDAIRSPEASDPTALKNLLMGVPGASVSPIDEATFTQTHHAVNDETRARWGEQKGLEAALRASLYGNDATPLISAAKNVYSLGHDRDLIQRYGNGDTVAQMQMGSIMPGLGFMSDKLSAFNATLSAYGYTPNDFAGRNWQQNKQILDAALGSTTVRVHGSGNSIPKTVDMLAAWQKKMNDKYQLGLKVSGVIDDSWAKAITTLSHSRSYSAQILASDASNAGFGGTFDSFKAFDANGNFTNTSDGRSAKEAVQQFVHAQHGQAAFLKGQPLLQQFGKAMPLQWFNNGGFNIGSGLDWVTAGNKGAGFSWNPIDLVTQNMAIPEHALFRGGLSSFDAINGGWQQGKTWIYAGESFGFNPTSWTASDRREAAKRLTKSATWLDILGEQKLANDHPNLDFVTNIVGDVIIAKKFGSPGETLGVKQWGRAMNDAVQGGDLSYGRALIGRSAYASERVKNAFSYGKEGRVGKAVEQLAGEQGSSSNMQAAEAFYGKNWIEDPESPFGTQFVLKDGTQLRPLSRAEETAYRSSPGLVTEPDKLHRWSDLLHDGKITESTHENMAAWETMSRQRLLNSWRAPGVPARSAKQFQRMQRFGLKGRAPIYTFHPLASAKGTLWQHVSNVFDWTDRTLQDSNRVGGFLDHVARNLRTGFTKSANPHPVPLVGADPRNIFRMAMNAGLRSRTGLTMNVTEEMGKDLGIAAGKHAFPSAEALEKMFIEGHADGSPAVINKVANEIKLAARAQGRVGAHSDAENAFSAYAEQGGEPYLQTQRAELEKMINDHLANKPGAVDEVPTTGQLVMKDIGSRSTNLELHAHEARSALDEALKSGNEELAQRLAADLDRIEAEQHDLEAEQSRIAEHHISERNAQKLISQTHETEWSDRMAMLTGMLDRVKGESAPLYESETLSKFGVPELLLRKDSGLGGLNSGLAKMSVYQRRALLATDPVLFYKHGVTDSIRRLIAEGPYKALAAPVRKRRLATWLEGHPDLKAIYDTLRGFTKDGEWRYDMEGSFRGGGPAEAFPSIKNPKAAAEYVDRRLMSGAYQAWKVDGKEGVVKWFLDSPEGQKLAEAENFKGEQSWFLAHMVAKNLDGIEMHAPGFLQEAEQIRNGAKDVRKALAKYIEKNKIDFPVSGHLSNDQMFNLAHPGRSLDNISMALVKAYLTPNKWNRGGLFDDMTANLWHDYTKAGGDPVDSFYAAMSQARTINRYHMLDLADALKIEQNIRWGALFFTKHRLYWTWLLQTMRARPQLAVAVSDLAKEMDQYQSNNPSQTPGTFTFHVPWRVPGMIGPGISGQGMDITIPVARLLWLTESSNNPGALSNAVHSVTTSNSPLSSIIPGRGSVEITTLDSTVNQLIMYTKFQMGKVKTSDGVLDSLSPYDQIRFQGIMARVQAGYAAEHHGKYLDDHTATEIALKHMLITGAWRATAFTGSYPNDPRLSTEQDKLWRSYNESPNPAEREKIRAANPWIDSLLGAYTGTQLEHNQQNQLWSQYNAIRADHEQRQELLLKDAKTNPDHVSTDLFGKAWHAEGKRYGDQINQLEQDAKQQGADSWLKSFKQDHFAQVYKLLSGQLHQMYGIPTKEAAKIAKGGRPPWVTTYRAFLYGNNAPLSDAAIAKMPPDQQQTLRETAAIYKQMIAPYGKEPATKVDKIRDQYFTKVYTPWVKQRDKYFQMAGREVKAEQGHVYDELSAWYDAQDKPTVMNGITFPSPERVHFAMLPAAAQQQHVRDQLTKQWGWLSGFDKSLLGVKVDPKVQAGWAYFNKTLYDTISGPKGIVHQTTKHPTVDPLTALKYAQWVDKNGYPGFYQDYVRGLTPVYVRLAQQKIGSTSNAQATWKAYLGKVSQMADWASSMPYTTDPVKLAARDQLFNKTLWTDLLTTGVQGVYNGVPLARVPDEEYPQGGVLYRLAMAQTDRTFRQEYRQWVVANPDFISLLFGTGG